VPANPDRPNIVVIWGDDIGWYNVSAYNLGVMGYRTPNIDRIAREGGLFTDWYGQQSCTAGRAAFITGQSPIRTGLTKVGLPGAELGLQPEDPTLAELLKPFGYVCGQYGKNHLGDRDEFLPTAHGFDEFFGNLYHLNAEEEPENPDYPKSPEFKERFGPRGVLKSKAGRKTIEDTGPLTKKRMETIDDEITAGALDFIDRSHKSRKPFFLWWNSTRMHIFTHLKRRSQGKTGLGIYPDGMVEHDAHVGQLLKKLDDLGIADNTIVMYSTDNGAECMTWPDGGTTPFRGEKNTNWEGGYRVPCVIRWPGVIEPGTVFNDICAHEDMIPTIMAAVGEPDIVEKLKEGYQAGNKSFKVHLDGYNLLPYLSGETDDSPRKEFLYWSDDGDLTAMRYEQWKIVFTEQRAHGFAVWQDPFVPLRAPKIFTLRGDPFERADDEGIDYPRWRAERLFLLVPAQALVARWLSSFQEFPPRQEPSSFGIDEVMEKIMSAAAGTK
jgi:arylsulfatase